MTDSQRLLAKHVANGLEMAFRELFFGSKRFPRDVAAELRAVEMDFFHRGIGGGLCAF